VNGSDNEMKEQGRGWVRRARRGCCPPLAAVGKPDLPKLSLSINEPSPPEIPAFSLTFLKLFFIPLGNYYGKLPMYTILVLSLAFLNFI